MNALNAVNILDSIIPISLFNKGQANKIFSDVKKLRRICKAGLLGDVLYGKVSVFPER